MEAAGAASAWKVRAASRAVIPGWAAAAAASMAFSWQWMVAAAAGLVPAQTHLRLQSVVRGGGNEGRWCSVVGGARSGAAAGWRRGTVVQHGPLRHDAAIDLPTFR